MCNWFSTQYFAPFSITVASSNPEGQDPISMASAVTLCCGKIHPMFSHPVWNSYLVYWRCVICKSLGCVASSVFIKTELLGHPSCASPSGRLSGGGNGRRRLYPCPKQARGLSADTEHPQHRALGVTRAVTEEAPASSEEGASCRACRRGSQRRQHSGGTTEDSGVPGRRERKNSRHRRQGEKRPQNTKHGMFWRLQR